MTPVIVIPADAEELSPWRLTFEVAELLDGIDWILAGAQMVILLEHEHGTPSGRTTGDVDSVIGGRAAVTATRQAAQRLEAAGFERSAAFPYRYERERDRVDLLTIDHLRDPGRGASTEPEDITSAAGGRRAMGTRRLLEIDVRGLGVGKVPVPSLSGAIAMKIRAFESRRADRDLEDLARLLAIVDDVEVIRAELKAGERRSLGRAEGLRDPNGAPWRVLRIRQDAQSAWTRIHDD